MLCRMRNPAFPALLSSSRNAVLHLIYLHFPSVFFHYPHSSSNPANTSPTSVTPFSTPLAVSSLINPSSIPRQSVMRPSQVSASRRRPSPLCRRVPMWREDRRRVEDVEGEEGEVGEGYGNETGRMRETSPITASEVEAFDQ